MSQFFPIDAWTDAQKSRSLFRVISYQRIGTFAAIADFVLILAASFIAGIAYHFLVLQIEGSLSSFFALGIYSALIFILAFQSFGFYRPSSLLSVTTQIRGVLIAWGVVLLLITSALFLLKTGAHYSRGATISFGFLGFVLVSASHAKIARTLRQALADGTLAGQRAIVIGDPEELASKSALQLLRTYGAREIARFELSPAADDTASQIASDTAIIDSGIKIAQKQRAEQVLLALRWVDSKRREFICERLRALPLPVLLLPDRYVASILAHASWELFTHSAIEVQRAPLSPQDLVLKRICDVLLASLALVALSPLLLATSVAIKLESPGPVIFRQRRKGFNGHEFAIYKFRTMTVLEDGPRIRQAQPHDERVTWVGRLLRASSIDELPQLFNVLVGEMSLVGPRPHAIAHDKHYSDSVDKYAFRHHVKPGITGWAQIHGLRGPTNDVSLMNKRVEFDLWYINNWSLLLDLRIIAGTFVEVLRRRNAY